MSLMKSDVKLGFMEEVAKKVDTFSKESEKRATEYDAVARAMKTAIPKVASLMEAIDADLDEEGKLEEVGKEPISVAKYAKSWVNRALATLTLMKDTADESAQKARGRVTAFGTTLDFLESLYVREKANRVRIEAMLASGELLAEGEGEDLVLEEMLEEVFSPKKKGNGSGSRPVGVRPAPSIAQRRKAEEKAEKEVERAGAVSQKDIPSTAKAPEEPAEEVPEPVESKEPIEAAQEAPEVAEAEPEKAEETPPEAPQAPPEPPPPPKPEPEPSKAAAPKAKSEPKTPRKRTRRTVAKERKKGKR